MVSKLELFTSVDESAGFPDPRVRQNAIIINQNFAALMSEDINVTFEMVNVGTHPGDGTGDSLRDAWIKVNENFRKLEELLRG